MTKSNIAFISRVHNSVLTHWGRVTHICVGNLTIIGSENGLSPGRRQAIIWTDAGILLIGTSWTNFNEILIEIPTFRAKKIHLKKIVSEMAAILSRSEAHNFILITSCGEKTPFTDVTYGVFVRKINVQMW